jgi:hypothetical protein
MQHMAAQENRGAGLAQHQNGSRKMENLNSILRLEASMPPTSPLTTPKMSIWVMSDPVMFGTV